MMLLGMVVVAGCATNRSVELPNRAADARPWTHTSFQNDPNAFQFAIVSDRNGGNRAGIFPEAVEKLNLLQPEFVMSVGDLIEGYSHDPGAVAAMHDEVDQELSPLEMPFFRVPGNHDLSNEAQVGVYQERYGLPYYHFRYGDVLFLCLDTEDPPSNHLSEAQLDYFERTLSQNRDVRWTLVFMHKPLWLDNDEVGLVQDTNWSRFEEMLQDRPYTVFAGHYHTYTKYERLGRDYYVFATTGGGSELAGPDTGQFDHIVWVTMEEDGPRVANVLLDGILPDDVVTERTTIAQLPTAPESFTFEPVWVGAKGFFDDTSKVTVENRSGTPVDVALRFDAHPRLLVTASPAEFVVPAEGTATFDLSLRAFEPIPANELEPVVGEAVFTASDVDGRTRRSTGPLVFAVQPRFPIPAGRIAVDGDLADWPELPYRVEEPAQIQFDESTWQGPQDSAFRFGVAADDNYLYVAVEARDDEMQLKEGAFPWEQDAVELRLSARSDRERSQSRGEGEFEDILLLAIVPGQTEQNVFGKEHLPEGLRAVSRATEFGHVTEVAIPHAYLNGKQSQSWEAMRLNVAVDDYDSDGSAQIWWQPDWRTRETLTGSGTFQRRKK
jgi:hypothetical protein